MPDWLSAIILGIVEGLTEFIPVSSTGHLIVVGEWLGFDDVTAVTFNIVIQLGAILAIAVLYRDRFRTLIIPRELPGFAGRRGWILLALSTFPAMALGGLTHGFITERLFTLTTVAIGWGLGGVALILIERYFARSGITAVVGVPAADTMAPEESVAARRLTNLDDMTWRLALGIGLVQCLSLWPGVSRAATTIVGGMLLGLSRKTATEYSFFAAIPIMIAASSFDLYTNRGLLTWADLPIFTIGFVTAFLAALVAVRWFLHIVTRYTLAPFGWYRIVAAIILLMVM